MRLFIKFSIVILILATTAQMIAAQTTSFSFQGKLTDQGNPPNGTYQMQFKLFDAETNGNQIGSTISIIAVTVTQGVFSTQLDFGVNAFPGADRFLEIDVRRNSGEVYVTLSPRQKITSSPYSIRTVSAQQADLALDANKLGGVNAGEYVTTSSVGNSFIKNDTTQQTANFNISGNGVFGGRIGIGTNTPASGLDIRGTGFIAQQRITDTTSGNSLVFQAGAGSNMKVTGFNYNTGTAIPLYLSVDGANTILNPNGGNVGIGTTNPILITGSSSRILSVTGSFSPGVALTNVGIGGNQYFIYSGSGNAGGTGHFKIYDATNALDRFTIANNGNVGIGLNNPFYHLDVFGGVRSLYNISTQMVAETTGGTNSWARFYMKTQNRTWFIGTSQNFFGDSLYIGDETANKLRLTIDAAGKVSLGILQITGGSDLAENFEVGDEEIKPGMIVAIDPENSGKLILARGAYNRRVAGIVSGANNLSAGMLLPDLRESENSLPVALSGRVWVYADAGKNPIKPGDLLTTSDTPGYAMKVTKYKKAQGAIIGKAMTELKSGTGLVLVLVNLQ